MADIYIRCPKGGHEPHTPLAVFYICTARSHRIRRGESYAILSGTVAMRGCGTICGVFASAKVAKICGSALFFAQVIVSTVLKLLKVIVFLKNRKKFIVFTKRGCGKLLVDLEPPSPAALLRRGLIGSGLQVALKVFLLFCFPTLFDRFNI